jgi:hypothetical protein
VVAHLDGCLGADDLDAASTEKGNSQKNIDDCDRKGAGSSFS